MKILLYCLNYAPELTGIGKYTGEQAEWLAARGHEVRVITAPPYYPAWRVDAAYSAWRYRTEVRNGVRVSRVPIWVPARPSGLKRLLHLASFALSSLPALAAQARWRPDVVFLVEPPLMCSPLTLLFGRWTRAKTWLHIQDFEVDAAFALGILRNPLLRKLACAVEHFVLTRFDLVSSISAPMVARARAKGASANSTMLLPNWVDLRTIRVERNTIARDRLGIPHDAVIALYSGNMGGKQGLEMLDAAARRLAGDPRIHFIFCGDGAGREALAARCAGLERVHLLPPQPTADFCALLASCDIHLMPQHAEASDLVLPSKLTTMLASSRPLVATAHPDCELGRIAAQFGRIVPPGDDAAFADAIAALAADPTVRASLGAAGRIWAEHNLDRDAILHELESAMQALLAQASGAGAPAGVTE